jgi:hypothetical protein
LPRLFKIPQCQFAQFGFGFIGCKAWSDDPCTALLILSCFLGLAEMKKDALLDIPFFEFRLSELN